MFLVRIFILVVYQVIIRYNKFNSIKQIELTSLQYGNE